MLKAARNSFTVPEPAAFHLHDDCARHSTRSCLFANSLNRSACCGVCVTHAGRPKRCDWGSPRQPQESATDGDKEKDSQDTAAEK